MISEGLIINVGLIFSLAMIFCLISQKWKLWAMRSKLILGMVFGTITILSMSYPVQLMDGLIFDGRSVVLSMSGLFGGPVVAVMTAGFATLYRLIIGGVGVYTGIGTIITSAGIGLGYSHLQKKYGLRLTAFNLYLFGLVVHVIVLAWMLTLPGDLKWEVIERIGIHFILVLPLGTLLLGTLLQLQQDIQEKKSSLQESQYRYKHLIDNISDGMTVYGAVDGGEDFIFIDINKSGEKIEDVKREDLIGKSLLDEFPGVKSNGLLSVLKGVWESGIPEHLPLSFYSDSRMSGWRSNYVFKLPSGEVVSVYTDETDKFKAESQRDQFFRLSLDMLCIAGFDGYFKQVNSSWTKNLGWSESELLSKPWLDFVHPDDKEKTVKTSQQLSSGKEIISFQNRYRCKDGDYRWLSWQAYPNLSEGVIFSAARDLTDKIHCERSIEEREEKLGAVFEAADNIAFIVSDVNEFDPVILEFSPGAEKIFGYRREELSGKPLSVLKTSEADKRLFQIQTTATSDSSNERNEALLMRKSGEAFPALVSTHPLRCKSRGIYAFLSVVLDISEEKKLEAIIIQSQKLEALGALTSGIAHDFNNLLTTITGNAYLSLMQLDDSHPVREEIEEIKQAGEKAATMTRQLLAFSRKQHIQPRVIKLNNLLEDLQKILRRLIGEQVQLYLALDVCLYPVEVDPGQMEQIILNLTVNARDAMPDGGELQITTSNERLDSEFFRSKGVAGHPGDYVKISCKDTGIGMSMKVQSQIFDPFFTTKEVGKGTGMGLSTVYGIVKQSSGYIWVQSSPKKGTTFEVHLPAVSKEVECPQSKETAMTQFGNSETILLVEDDAGVRKLVQTVLSTNGYTVLPAGNAREALDISSRHEETIPLMITDVIMPGLSGPALAEQLQDQRPDMRVIFTSGYPFDKLEEAGVTDLKEYFVEKPIRPEPFLLKVRSLLDSNDHGLRFDKPTGLGSE